MYTSSPLYTHTHTTYDVHRPRDRTNPRMIDDHETTA